KRSSSPDSVPALPESPCSFAPWCVTSKRSFSRSIMCMRFYINNTHQAAAFGGWLRPGMGLRLTLHRDWNRSAVELNPRNLDRIHHPARNVNENRRSHTDLERSRSDNASLLKSRVTHRVSLAPGRGRRGD